MICAGCARELPSSGAMCPHCGRFVAMERSEPPRDGGRLLASVMMVVAIFVAGVLGIELFAYRSYHGNAMRSSARYDLLALRPIAEKYVDDHPGECPTMARLKAEGELSASSKITDPWDVEYKITCRSDRTVDVRSFGPDRTEGTADDITAEETPSSR